MKNSSLGFISLLAMMAATSQAAITWDGEGGDGLWATPENWDSDSVPISTDDVVVGLSATVTSATNVFSNLEIQSGASVALASDTGASNRITVAGTLGRNGGVLRLNGADIELTATGKLAAGITFLDTNNGTMTFANGAAFANPNMGFEHKGTNVFNYTLATTGFTTLVAGGLYSGNNGSGAATWSNVTYNIDVSNYDLSNGTVVTLADYASGNLPGNFATDATVNITTGSSGLNPKVTFNTSTSSLIVRFPKIWDGGAAGSWATAANWNPDQLPLAADEVIVGSSAAVTNCTNAFSRLDIEAGASVTMIADSASSNTIKVAGTLNRVGVHRLNGAKVELTATGKLGTGITFLDTNGGKMSFTSGAAFGNPTMSFEHKGTNTFNYTLSPTGFTPMVAGSLFGTAWANSTYNIDVSNYDINNGTIVTLADYTSPGIPVTFNPTVNFITGSSGLNPKLTFNASTSSLIVRFPKIWDGGAAGSWATATNWNADQLPIAADEVIVGSSAAVTDGANAFTSLDIQAGASVSMIADSGASNTIKVAGTLDRSGGVYRLNGAKIELTETGSLGSGITFLDTNGGKMSFANGASFGNPNMDFEHKGTNTFTYTLSPAGFTTMIAGTLRDGAGAVWANATYNIDISAYTISNGGTITLVDYAGHTTAFNGTFDPTVNIIAGSSGLTGTLAFDTATSKLVLTIPTGAGAYGDWATLKGVTGGKLEDDDKDSLTNLEEYAWGTEPGTPNGNPIAGSTNGSGHLEISATKGAEAGADASTTYVVKASFDLVNWTTAGVTTTTNNATNLVASYTGPAVPPAGKVFLRVFLTNE